MAMPTVYPSGFPETLPSATSPPISRQIRAAAPSRRETILNLVELLLQQNEESAQGAFVTIHEIFLFISSSWASVFEV